MHKQEFNTKQQQALPMKVAFGKVKLTPKDGVIGKTLAGYSPIAICSGILDDIHAHAVLIEDTMLGNIKKRILLITTDFLKIPLTVSNYIKEQIEDEYNIHPGQILIHAIHTHKSLDMGGEFVFPGGIGSVIRAIMFGAYHADDKYKVWIARQIVKLVGSLVSSLEPARIAWTRQEIDAPITLNRRHPTTRPRKDLGIISFKSASSGELIGMIINYAMHPTTLSAGVSKLSADYPGRIVSKIEELSNGKVHALFFTGPCGDLNPITTCGTDFENLDKNKNLIYNQKGTYVHTKKIGYYLGEKAYEIATSIPDEQYYSDLEFKAYTHLFWVPMKDYKVMRLKKPPSNKFSSRFKEWLNSIKIWLSNRIVHLLKRIVLLRIALLLADANEPNFPGFAIKHKGRDIEVYSILQYIEFKAKNGKSKDVKRFSIFGIPGELFEQYGSEIIKTSPTGKDTFIFENSNDNIGYLFPVQEYLQGGYEPLPSFSPLCGKYVMDAYKELLQFMDVKIVDGFF
ncbi:MAG: hypothetical protein ACTSVI_15625 [Promethearchaeota archaeon]